MPFVRNGRIYVPQSTLEQLGIVFVHELGLVLLVKAENTSIHVLFDLESGDNITHDGVSLPISPLSRFGALFFPVGNTNSAREPLSVFFDINFQIIPTEPAPTVRLYNAPIDLLSHNAVLRNGELLFGFTERYAAFTEDPSGETEGAVVTPPAEEPEAPGPPPEQEETPRPPVPTGPVSISFVGLSADTDVLLDALRSARVPAGFFVTEEDVLAHPDLVRRLHGEGHQVGIFLSETAEEEYRAASEALFEAARLWTVLVAAGSREVAEDAYSLGLVVFDSNVRQIPSGTALETLSGNLLLDNSAPGSAFTLAAIPGELRGSAFLVVSFVRSLF